ncbi:hypothetical protein [Vibrio parahaemolyticus]|uniref:hypothetical protein n=1 Tax=Vibrio parahaemolyticus TaxID=670 RepID=UPI0030ECA69F
MFFSSSPQPLVNGAHLCEELTRFLSENKSDFEQKLIPDLSHIDHMAHNVNGIEIKNISFVVDNDDGFIEIDFPEYEERDTREEF